MLEKIMAKFVKHQFEKGMEYRPIVEGIMGNYNLPYIEDGNPYHLLDVYYPESTGRKYPLIVYVHGGAWVANTKEHNRSYAEYLASFGYCVVNLSYRLLPDTDVRGQIQDVGAAIQYCMEDLDIEEADTSKVIWMGDSAGAHLISTIYCLMQEESLRKKFCISLKAISVRVLVLQNMVSDLSVFRKSDKWYLKAMCRLLYGGYGKAGFDQYEASFLELVRDTTGHVPMILVGSAHDPLYMQSVKMAEYLKNHHWSYRTIFWGSEERKELGHVFQVTHPEWEESRVTHERVFRYIEEVLAHGDSSEFEWNMEEE